jgi:2-polyprenyl-6-methoxyphenol hydroxylase-like FAD-dependent oxidoreductase
MGDAAHPMTPDFGQGGCQAIEDAIFLAHYLAKQPSLPEALAAYEKARIPRANEIVDGPSLSRTRDIRALCLITDQRPKSV